MKASLPKTRLGLAKWIVDPENPLPPEWRQSLLANVFWEGPSEDV